MQGDEELVSAYALGPVQSRSFPVSHENTVSNLIIKQISYPSII
jgi:hypothetical protein